MLLNTAEGCLRLIFIVSHLSEHTCICWTACEVIYSIYYLPFAQPRMRGEKNKKNNNKTGARSAQRTQRTFCWTFALFALLNDCSQRTFAERKQTTNWSVCYSEQRWRRPQGLFQNAKVLYIAQTVSSHFVTRSFRHDYFCVTNWPAADGGEGLWST